MYKSILIKIKLVVFMLLTFYMTACGQKGELYLPDEKVNNLISKSFIE